MITCGLMILLAAPRAGAQLTLFLYFNTDASGITLGGSGSSAATMAMGTVKAYGGSVPTGVTKTVNPGTNWTLSTIFDVYVLGLNIIIPNYTLLAKLQTADTVNTWTVASQTLNSTSPTTLTTSGTYNTNVPYTFGLTIPFSESAGPIANTINFVAIGN